MPRVHFLNVRNGACSIIQHGSGRVSVIDVNCAFIPAITMATAYVAEQYQRKSWEPVSGNYGQKEDEDNPVEDLRKLKVSRIFRFILTHPDMDHLGGVKDLFTEFNPINFWDTANTKEFEKGSFGSRTDLEADWEFYKNIRDTSPSDDPYRLVYYSGAVNEYYKSDGLTILAPTPALIADGNRRKKWNDASYVILYRAHGKKILFAGDSEDKTWEHILKTWKDEVSNLDVLIAPHHGRHSGRNYDFLDVTKPKLTLYGNAPSEHQGYDAWNKRGLLKLTNNQAGYIILDITKDGIDVFVKNEKYARNIAEENKDETWYSADLDAWYLGHLID
jgi:beta-lactamase superfamily II metal-dependent hydrolase